MFLNYLGARARAAPPRSTPMDATTCSYLSYVGGECSKMPRVSKMSTPLKRIASCRFVF